MRNFIDAAASVASVSVNFTKAVDACSGVRNVRGKLHGAPRD